MKRYSFVFLFSLLFTLGLNAETQYLTLSLKAGGTISVELSDEPVIKFLGDNLVIKSNINEITYPKMNVLKYIISSQNSGASIDEVSVDKMNLFIQYTSTGLKIDGIKDNINVLLYNINGILIESKTPLNNSILIDFSDKAKGIYVVVIGDLTYKYIWK